MFKSHINHSKKMEKALLDTSKKLESHIREALLQVRTERGINQITSYRSSISVTLTTDTGEEISVLLPLDYKSIFYSSN